MKKSGILATFVLTTLLGAGASQAKGPTIKIGAIFQQDRPAANLGGPEARTLEMLVQETNRRVGWPAIRSS